MENPQQPHGTGCKTVLLLIFIGLVGAALIYFMGKILWGDIGSYYLFLAVFFVLIVYMFSHFIKVKRKN